MASMKQSEMIVDPLPTTEALIDPAADADRSRADLLAELEHLRERAEVLEQAERETHALYDAVPDALLLLDEDGQIVEANQAAGDRLGYARADLCTLSLRDIVLPSHATEMECRIAEARAGNGVPFEMTFLAGGGRHFCCEALACTVERNSETLVQCVARDISHRDPIDAASAEASEAKYRTIFEDSLDAKSLIQDGKILDVNMAWLRLHGFSSEAEVVGADVMDFVHEDDQRILAKRRRSGPPELVRVYQLRDVKKDGGVIDVELYSSSLTVNGKPAIISTVRDITRQKHIEREREQLVKMLSEYNLSLEQVNAELERSNRELEDFAHVVSHDLQEPLRMVRSYLKLLDDRHGTGLSSEAREFFDYALSGARSMQRLITDLLDYATVDTGEKRFQAVDVAAVIEHSLANLHVAVHETGAAVTYKNLPNVTGDEVQIGQLFQNLLGNAIKFHGHEPPRIRIKAKPKGNTWLFSVKDNGIGIEEEYAKRIFTIFQRLHGKKDYPGSGIGLSICKKIVERHGGRIWVESETGKGATFYFTLPSTPDAPSEPKGLPPRPLQVLLAEDNEGDARLMQETIERMKHDVTLHWVEDGVEAIEFLWRRGEHADAPRVDLVLLDLNMPRRNGHEVLAEIKASRELQDLPVAVITTSREKKDILKSGSLKATWYVTKPVDLQQILSVIEAV